MSSLREEVARAIAKTFFMSGDAADVIYFEDAADAAIAVIVEKCAEVALKETGHLNDGVFERHAGRRIAARIRSLKDKS
jgi:hypothetical protein